MVLYVPLEHPKSLPQVREFDSPRADSWNDFVDDCGCKALADSDSRRRRFEYVRP
jgi:hypothetical protein